MEGTAAVLKVVKRGNVSKCPGKSGTAGCKSPAVQVAMVGLSVDVVRTAFAAGQCSEERAGIWGIRRVRCHTQHPERLRLHNSRRVRIQASKLRAHQNRADCPVIDASLMDSAGRQTVFLVAHAHPEVIDRLPGCAVAVPPNVWSRRCPLAGFVRTREAQASDQLLQPLLLRRGSLR